MHAHLASALSAADDSTPLYPRSMRASPPGKSPPSTHSEDDPSAMDNTSSSLAAIGALAPAPCNDMAYNDPFAGSPAPSWCAFGTPQSQTLAVTSRCCHDGSGFTTPVVACERPKDASRYCGGGESVPAECSRAELTDDAVLEFSFDPRFERRFVCRMSACCSLLRGAYPRYCSPFVPLPVVPRVEHKSACSHTSCLALITAAEASTQSRRIPSSSSTCSLLDPVIHRKVNGLLLPKPVECSPVRWSVGAAAAIAKSVLMTTLQAVPPMWTLEAVTTAIL